jgi:hypothetical protein
MSLRINSDFNGVTDPDAGRYIAAVEAADDNQLLEFGVGKAINDFVVGCKQDRIWDAIKASCILAGARTLAGALVPLAGIAPTNVGGLFVDGDYSRKTGLKGNSSTKTLNTNRAENADPQDSVHLSIYQTEKFSAVDYVLFGTDNSSSVGLYVGGVTSGVVEFNGYNRNTLAFLVSTSAAVGFAGHSRINSSTVNYRFFSNASTITRSSNASNSTNYQVFGAAGLTTNRGSGRLAFYSIGESLDLALLDTRVTRLIAEINFGINTGLSGAGYNIDTLNYINAGYDAGGSLA